MLDKKFLKQQNRRLKQEKKTITKELRTFARKDKKLRWDFDTIFPHFGRQQDENAAEVTAYENKLPLEHNLELRLKNIGEALERIKKGKYGVCEKCKKPIAIKRLEAFPEAETCIKCK